MKRILRCLAMAVTLVFLFSSAAMAVDTFNILSVAVLDGGYLNIIGGTDYTDQQDLNFTAKTENGEVQIDQSFVLSKEGTSWFIILDYHTSVHYKDSLQKCQNALLKELATVIQSKDEGALVPSNFAAEIHLDQASTLRDELTATPSASETAALVPTLGKVMDYIAENRQNLMPNVAVVMITSALEDIDLTEAERILENNRGTTTHIICTLPKVETAGEARRAQGDQLQKKAKLTVGGTGYITESGSEDEGRKAVKRIQSAERRKIYMLLDPQNSVNTGKELTITQKTAGGKEMSETINIDALYDSWNEALKSRTPQQEQEAEGFKPSNIPSTSSTNSASRIQVNQNYNPPVPTESGLSTELLIGIILAVVVIALVVVLLITRKKKGGKSNKSAPVYADSASSQSSGTTVTLSGDNGTVLKGTMKNNRLTIGRDAGRGAMVAIPNDGKLSGLHCTLTKQGGGITLTDNGSTNGTKVNGTKVTGTVNLNQNDKVTMGSATYTITWR